MLGTNTGNWFTDLTQNRGSMAIEDFISYLFLSVVARQPTQDELDTLTQVINSASSSGGGSLNIANRLNDKAKVVLDYLSRLPETYYFKAIN